MAGFLCGIYKWLGVVSLQAGKIKKTKTMNKNEIINKVVTNLLSERSTLSRELSELNHNEASFLEKRTTLENAINQIDMSIDRRIMDCEMYPV